MIHPLDYSKDSLLYIVASATTIAMVLVQDNLHGQEHVIYYANKNLIDSKTRYSHVEKLALATVIVVQKFLSLHFASYYHHIGRLEPNVLHSDSSGTQGQVLPLDRHPSRV